MLTLNHGKQNNPSPKPFPNTSSVFMGRPYMVYVFKIRYFTIKITNLNEFYSFEFQSQIIFTLTFNFKLQKKIFDKIKVYIPVSHKKTLNKIVNDINMI